MLFPTYARCILPYAHDVCVYDAEIACARVIPVGTVRAATDGFNHQCGGDETCWSSCFVAGEPKWDRACRKFRSGGDDGGKHSVEDTTTRAVSCCGRCLNE